MLNQTIRVFLYLFVALGLTACDDPLWVCTNFPDDPVCKAHNPPDDDPPFNGELDITATRRESNPNEPFVVPGRQLVWLFNFNVTINHPEPTRLTRFVIQITGNDPNVVQNLKLTDQNGNHWNNIGNQNGQFIIEADLNPNDLNRWTQFSVAVDISENAPIDNRFSLCLVEVGWEALNSHTNGTTPIVDVCNDLHQVVPLAPITIRSTDGVVDLPAPAINPEILCLEISPAGEGDITVTEIIGWVTAQNGDTTIERVTLMNDAGLAVDSGTDEGEHHGFTFSPNYRIRLGETGTLCIVANGRVGPSLQETAVSRVRVIDHAHNAQVAEMLFPNDPGAPPMPLQHTFFTAE